MRSLVKHNKDQEARISQLEGMLRQKKSEDEDLRFKIARAAEMSISMSYGTEQAPNWESIANFVEVKLAKLEARVLAEGQLLPFIERGYIRENQKLWHMLRAVIDDPTLLKPNEKNSNTMTEGPWGGEERADFSRN